ncbi:helix-turn-helix domain-containing protein [Desulfurobacterium indicum]|uniref:HTH cro/C1-type domain-containing protein n=1 Tax=Desulfurobacterium indicum TaxID=1914305 RepID=A0A1R1MJR5_9BACT|nr:helix-turn-helix transcriptional regulator [Desulfurobacterium indicum]OMH39940.1 hypothetical protein BLW93_07905 [Desulfurobacterium indicum]
MCKEAFQDVAAELTKLAIFEAHKRGYTYEMIAFRVGVSSSSIEKYAYGERIPSQAVFLALVVGLKLKEPVKKLAELVGLRAVEVSKTSLSTSIGKAMKETGEAIAEVTKALEDGEITDDERQVCLKEINEAIDELIKLKQQMEREE